jgi:hypothetical protein
MAIGDAASKHLAINFPWGICMSPCRQRETGGTAARERRKTAPLKLTIKASVATTAGESGAPDSDGANPIPVCSPC